jgi:hypothetical protein
MISIISIINNDIIAKEFLLRGLSRQNTKYDLILINNRNSSFRSAAQAYNEGSVKAKGEYLMFIHQDVLLPCDNWLKEAEQSLSTISNLGIAGVSGMLRPKFINDFEPYARYYLLEKLNISKIWYFRYGRGNVLHGREKKPILARSISEIVSTRTLDELLLIIPRKVFADSKFDKTICDNWHFYGVDYALSESQKYRNVCVLPQSVFHLSTGKVNKSYFKTLRKLIEKHRNEKIINTTIYPWSTRPKLLELQIHDFLSKGLRRRNQRFS